MAKFVLKTDLPHDTQVEIDRVQALASGVRTTQEAAFLVALAPYLTNEVLEVDGDGLILKAAGNTLPTGLEDFRKGATFIKKDATLDCLYINVGDETSASWDIVENGSLDEVTPVNAVAATGVLTSDNTNVADNETVVIGGRTYTFQSAIGVAAAATGTLTFTGLGVNTNTVVIGTRTYTFKTALTEKKATGTLTAGANFADGDSVTIDGHTYIFTTNLTVPARADEVKIGASASISLDNLIAAINGAAGAGTTYGTGTVAHTSVDAAAGAGDTMDVTAKTIGVAGNSIATTEQGANSSWGGATLSTGADAVADEIKIGVSAEACIDNLVAAINAAAGAGTNYSTGTTAHADVTAAKSGTDKCVVTAKVAGDSGNAIASTETCANASWGGATLAGGEDADAADMVLIGSNADDSLTNLRSAINGTAGAGTKYGTGTVTNADFTCGAVSSHAVTITAKVKGTAKNDIATTETSTHLSWGGAVTSGGVDGTEGKKGDIAFDADNIYVCTADNTVADTNWKKAALSAV